jgi:plastocyanin
VAVVTAAMTLAAQPGPTLRVLAGLGQGVVSVNQYAGDPAFPEGNTVRIAEGTTVIWTLGSDEPHTITFRAGEPWPSVFMEQPEGPGRPPMYNPRLVSATAPAGPWDGTSFIHLELQGRGQEVTVTFAREGRYRYSCLLHEEMDGFVEVVAPGSAGITTQSVVDQFAASHLAADHATDVAKMIADRSRASRIDTVGGTSLWFVRAGTNERRGHVDVNAFLPDTLSVRQGDTVVWYTDHSVPHTVTFPAPQGPRPEMFALQLPDGTMVQPPAPGQQPPPALLEAAQNPATAPRLVAIGGVPNRPNSGYDGRSLYNSGLIGEHVLVAYPMERTWALTFDTPGVFSYVCLLHEQQGMKGTLTVTPP